MLVLGICQTGVRRMKLLESLLSYNSSSWTRKTGIKQKMGKCSPLLGSYNCIVTRTSQLRRTSNWREGIIPPHFQLNTLQKT